VLKLAIIMEGIHQRHQSGHALDDLSAGLAGTAPALLETGLLLAAGKGWPGWPANPSAI
jgi:hypothetical protein